MDIMPPQEMTDETKPFGQGAWKWVLMLVVVLGVVWLWVSWRSGGFPFGTQDAVTQQTQQTQQSVLDSLTPPASSASTSAATDATLDQLTPPPSSAKTKTVDTAVLDSLSPPK